MTRIFVSIVESTLGAALESIRRLDDDRIGIEVRVDAFDPSASCSFDPAEIRATSSLPMIYTRRSGSERPGPSVKEIEIALDAGFDLVDVELDGSVATGELPPSSRDRLLLSLHDYDGVPPIERQLGKMESTGIPNIKIAVTPRSFAEDLSVLRHLARYRGGSNLTLFGMGSRGLYSRTLAPFLGSKLSFVALDEMRSAAPGQLSLSRGLEVWQELPEMEVAALFAVVGRPVAHSRSPRIHNARFRENRVSAAYGMIEPESIGQVLSAMEESEPLAPTGLSVTAPFKEDLYDEAVRRSWTVTERARRVGTANTVANVGDRFVVDNTDVLGFRRALEARTYSRIAILGAGGTARAAIAAIDAVDELVVFNRTLERAEKLARPMKGEGRSLKNPDLQGFDVVIDTLPSSAGFDSYPSVMKRGGLLIRAAYEEDSGTELRAEERGIEVFGAIDLLEAQAEEQSRLFLKAAGGTE
ncbi:MAG: type I 3-dehydroquinate dehydratase [Thermoanaerobaculia bacterium]|nr:type I 3-dehydroquinate dehydratase [Thermoanaerobaculia bacterium]